MPGNLTVSIAEASLGRSLSWVELLWVERTAGWTPYEMHLFLIAVLLAAYICINTPFLLLQCLNISWLEKYRIQKAGPKAQDGKNAVLRCITTILGDLFGLFGPLAVTAFPIFKVSGISDALPLPSLSEVALHLGTFFVFQDFWDYWLHRWMHSSPWAYRIIHARHHEFTAPTSVAATYAHPLELIIFGVPLYLGPLIVRCHLATWWAWLFVRELQAAEVHSGYDFPWSLNRFVPFYGGAAFHDLHHAAGGTCRTNFATIFTWCDILYGTESKASRARRLSSKRSRSSKVDRPTKETQLARTRSGQLLAKTGSWRKFVPSWPFERVKWL